MKRIVVPTESGRDWQRLLAKPELHWKPGKSAMSAAASWEAAGDRFPCEVSAALAASGDPDLASLDLLLAVPEWEIELPGGLTTSHTDVLALARNDRGLVAVAVEAKVDEEFGPTLGEKRAAPSSGQSERLMYLHEVLQLPPPLPDSIRYQLLHRTVSAILTARLFHAHVAVMLVQSFSPIGRGAGERISRCSVVLLVFPPYPTLYLQFNGTRRRGFSSVGAQAMSVSAALICGLRSSTDWTPTARLDLVSMMRRHKGNE